MQKEEFYSNHLKCVVVRIDKRKARQLYEKGQTVYMQGCTMRFDNVWQTACPICKNDERWEGQTFDSLVNDYIHYNCDTQRGKYPHFYVKKFEV